MKTAIHFQDVTKFQRGLDSVKVSDLKIYEKESIAFYGLPSDHVEILINQITGTYTPDEGALTVFGMDSREIPEQTWFELVENFAILHHASGLQENASVGENVANIYRIRNEFIEEPQLSAQVLQLANLVQLSITDLAKMMNEASSSLRMRVEMSRVLAFQPRVLILCEPTSDMDAAVAHEFVELLRRVRRKLKFLLILFTSDVWLMEEIADRVLFLNLRSGDFVENQLRGWYHKLLPFLKPQPERLFQLTRDVLQHGRTYVTEKMKG